MLDRTKTILLVEDNDDDVELTRRTFKKAAVANEIVVARDGESALDWVFARGIHEGRAGGLPQLVLLDLRLPGMGGIDVLRELRADERTRTLPVVVLTSSDRDEDIVTSYGLGANGFVRKPVSIPDFSNALSQIGAYWLLINSSPP